MFCQCRNKILSEKYQKTNKKIPTSFIFIDSEIIDNYIITSTKTFEKFKDILNNDICLHILPIYKILLL